MYKLKLLWQWTCQWQCKSKLRWHRQEVATLARGLALDMDCLEQAQAARLIRSSLELWRSACFLNSFFGT